jgi:hypothetical protein
MSPRLVALLATRRPRLKGLDAPFAVADIEALWWNQYLVGCFVTSEGDETRCATAAHLSAVIESFPGRVFFHFGGRYDFFFLSEPKTVALSGSGILRAQLGRASLYDSWYLFQMSLAKLGKAVGTLKFEGKSDAIETLTLDEAYAHCRQDCEVLRQALLKHRTWCASRPHESPRWPATAGGTAVYCLEAYEPDGVETLRAERVELGAWFSQYGAVTGGRVELWQHGLVKGPVYSYDIRSSYPASWLDGPLPLGPWRHVVAEVSGPAVYRCNVRQSRSTFPVVAPGHRWQYDGEAWLTHEEVDEVRLHGGRVDVVEGWASQSDAVPFGQHFAREMYAAKQAGDPWAKVSINSAHGKFGQGVLQTNWIRRDGRWESDYELGFPAWHQRPLISAYVLARARIRLHRALHALRKQGARVLYVDTDCVHTNCPPDAFPGVLGDELGQWAHEFTARRAVYVAPKVYRLEDENGGFKMAAKGLPREQVTFELMREAARGNPVSFTSDKGLVGFRRLGGAWEARRSKSKRSLSTKTGGKNHVVGQYGLTGRLTYKDEHE